MFPGLMELAVIGRQIEIPGYHSCQFAATDKIPIMHKLIIYLKPVSKMLQRIIP